MTRLETGQPIDIIVKSNGGVEVVEPQLRIAPIAGGSGEYDLAVAERVTAKNRLSGDISMTELYDKVVVRVRDLAGRNAGPRSKKKR